MAASDARGDPSGGVLLDDTRLIVTFTDVRRELRPTNLRKVTVFVNF